MRILKIRPPLESSIENSFLTKVKRGGLPIKTRKMNGMGFRDWPDRLIVGPKRFMLWIEFKRPKLGKVSPGQEDLFGELDEWGYKVHIFTNAALAYEFVKQKLKEHLNAV